MANKPIPKPKDPPPPWTKSQKDASDKELGTIGALYQSPSGKWYRQEPEGMVEISAEEARRIMGRGPKYKRPTS